MSENKYSITSEGELVSYAWPGGYPVIYITEDNGVLCPDCANGKNDSEAYLDTDNRGRSAMGDLRCHNSLGRGPGLLRPLLFGGRVCVR